MGLRGLICRSATLCALGAAVVAGSRGAERAGSRGAERADSAAIRARFHA